MRSGRWSARRRCLRPWRFRLRCGRGAGGLGCRARRVGAVGLGPATFRVAGTLTREPDRVGTAAILGPRVLISAEALPSTGLIAPGAMVRSALRLIAPDPAGIARDIPITFPNKGWRVRDPSDAAPG